MVLTMNEHMDNRIDELVSRLVSDRRVSIIGSLLASRICAEVEEIGNKAPEEEGREHEPDD